MCMSSGSSTPPPAPPAPPPPPPAPPPVTLQPAVNAPNSANPASTNKGRKALRIDLANSNQGGASGLNLPV